MIKFSIITVCLNAGSDLIETVTSTIAQTYTNYEIIVKDGMSSDGSLNNLIKDQRIRIISQKDSGIYDAMNQGIRVATGDYLIFMNAGDKFYNETVLEQLVHEIQKNNASIYYGQCYNNMLKVLEPTPQKLTKYFCYRSMVCHQATVYKADLFAKRKYNTNYKVSADKEFLLYCIIRAHVKSQYVPIIIALYQDGGFSSSSYAQSILQTEKKQMVREYFSIIERIEFGLLHSLTFPEVRKMVLKNSSINRAYRKVINRIYGNQSGSRGE